MLWNSYMNHSINIKLNNHLVDTPLLMDLIHLCPSIDKSVENVFFTWFVHPIDYERNQELLYIFSSSFTLAFVIELLYQEWWFVFIISIHNALHPVLPSIWIIFDRYESIANLRTGCSSFDCFLCSSTDQSNQESC